MKSYDVHIFDYTLDELLEIMTSENNDARNYEVLEIPQGSAYFDYTLDDA